MQNLVFECRDKGIPLQGNGFEDYLRDESKFTGSAEGLVKARNEHDVVELLVTANRWKIPVTVVSGKTSLTGASVPETGIVLDLKALDFVNTGNPSLVGPGINLKQYKDIVRDKGFFYPPDPTSEDSCTLGGNVATNASGALSYLYGPTRNYVLGLRLALPTGRVMEIRRGQVISSEGTLEIPAELTSPKLQRDILLPLPRESASSWRRCKNSAGLYHAEPLDLVDLFIGSEGILGVFLQVETRLLRLRHPYFALVLYMPDRDCTVRFVQFVENLRQYFYGHTNNVERKIREELSRLKWDSPAELEPFRGIVPSCMEWIGRSVAPILDSNRTRKLRQSYGAIYLEQEYPRGADPLERASLWAALVDAFNKECPSGRIVTEAALDRGQIHKLRVERQAIPEKLNELIRPGLMKVGMDFAVPMDRLEELLILYETLPSTKSFCFGHIGNAHIHCNLVPDTPEEMEEFREIYRDIAKKVCLLGGSVSGEHGIGKLKHEALKTMIGPEAVEEIKVIKRAVDPRLILNVGNMVPVS